MTQLNYSILIFSIPPWAEEVMKSGSDFEHLALIYFTIFTHNTEMKKLRSGYLLKEILDRSANKTQSKLSPDRSLWMYFAHDNSMVDMLNSLGLYNEVGWFGRTICTCGLVTKKNLNFYVFSTVTCAAICFMYHVRTV